MHRACGWSAWHTVWDVHGDVLVISIERFFAPPVAAAAVGAQRRLARGAAPAGLAAAHAGQRARAVRAAGAARHRAEVAAPAGLALERAVDAAAVGAAEALPERALAAAPRAVGANSKSNAVFLNHSPGALEDLAQAVQKGFMVGRERDRTTPLSARSLLL